MRQGSTFLVIAGLAVVMALAGCASYSGYSGVENIWRSDDLPEWVVGITTGEDVIARLGPPSQLIGLENETVYYYLHEQRKGKALVLLVYNWGRQTMTYDRAVFFFDKQGRLTKYSYSSEALPYDAMP